MLPYHFIFFSDMHQMWLPYFSTSVWKKMGKKHKANQMVKVQYQVFLWLKFNQISQNTLLWCHPCWETDQSCQGLASEWDSYFQAERYAHWQQISIAQRGSVAWKCQKCHSESVQIITSRLQDHSLEPERQKERSHTSRLEISISYLKRPC